MAYRRVDLALDNVVSEPQQIVSRDQRIREIIILAVADGASVELQFGNPADKIDVAGPLTFQPDGEEARAGLFWTNAVAQAGVVITIYIVFGGGELNAELEKV